MQFVPVLLCVSQRARRMPLLCGITLLELCNSSVRLPGPSVHLVAASFTTANITRRRQVFSKWACKQNTNASKELAFDMIPVPAKKKQEKRKATFQTAAIYTVLAGVWLWSVMRWRKQLSWSNRGWQEPSFHGVNRAGSARPQAHHFCPWRYLKALSYGNKEFE